VAVSWGAPAFVYLSTLRIRLRGEALEVPEVAVGRALRQGLDMNRIEDAVVR
jgi:hypothetical protein